jgi:hypothetical protein
MTSPTPTSTPVSTTEIAALLAWARSLTKDGHAADPNQRAAYQAAKTALLDRITNQQPDTAPTKDTP